MKNKSLPEILATCLFILLNLFVNNGAAFPYTAEPREGLYLPLGINVNYHHEEKVNFGFELGSAYYYGMETRAWVGSFADFTTDLEEYRFSVGSEFGYAIFGFDVGYGGIFTDSGYRHAIVGRFCIPLPLYHFNNPASVPLLIPYVRYSLVFSGDNYIEYGILIKYSLRIYDPEARY